MATNENPSPSPSHRVDKYLWATRIFKTRADATDACKAGKVWINGLEAKASKEVKAGDTIIVRKGPIRYNYKVLSLLPQRISAKNVEQYLQNITPPEEMAKITREHPIRPAGRPTKKDRRDIERMMGLSSS